MVFFYKANQLDKFEGSGSHQNGGTRAISRYGETLRNLEIKSTFSPVGMDFNTYKCNNFHLKTAMLYSNMNSIYHVGVPMYFRKTTYRYIITSSGFSAWKCHNYLLMCKENVPIHFKKKDITNKHVPGSGICAHGKVCILGCTWRDDCTYDLFALG